MSAEIIIVCKIDDSLGSGLSINSDALNLYLRSPRLPDLNDLT